MTLFRPLAALLLIATAACATRGEEPPAPSWYIMRHLEKAEGNDPGLTPAGRANAEALHAFLQPRQPGAIYVSRFRRSQETAAPLAARLGLTPKIYDPADTAALVARVRAEPNGPVLIVGHSNTVPDIVRQLGGVELRPMREDEFGQVWLVHGDGATRVRRLPAP
jgi:broad specificity phosphatase PhoE